MIQLSKLAGPFLKAPEALFSPSEDFGGDGLLGVHQAVAQTMRAVDVNHRRAVSSNIVLVGSVTSPIHWECFDG